MRIRFLIVALSLTTVLSAGMMKAQVPVPRQPLSANAAASEMQLLKSDPLRLRNFLKAMPKGGDLHNHLSGAVYAESYLQWAADDHDCIDVARLAIVKPSVPGKCKRGQVSAEAALLDPSLHVNLLAAMSMYQYLPSLAHDSGHDHFFATFGRFGAVTDRHWGDMLTEVSERAAAQNELYLELMLGLDRGLAGAYGKKVVWSDDLATLHRRLLDAGIKKLVPKMRAWLDDAERNRASRCGNKSDAGCAVAVRYLFPAYRGSPKKEVFAQFVAGFELANVDPRVVGIKSGDA